MTLSCVIQARMGSTRLPGKVLSDLGGRPMLRYMLDRLHGLDADALVVATSDLEADDPVADVAADAGALVVRGSESDVLARYGMALDAYPADTVVRLTADCPLMDPALVAAVVARHRDAAADYTCNVLPRSFPKGLDVEVMQADALRAAIAEAADPAEREHVTPFLYRHPERFVLANLRSGDDLGDERWTVDTAEDLAFVRSVVERLGHEASIGWRDVLELVGRTSLPAANELRLRPAMLDDRDRLLAWRNDPHAIRTSVSGRAVEPDEHDRWLRARLADPGCRLWIGERDGAALGSIRMDVTAAIGELSIVVAPDTRGAGIGTELLRLVQQALQGDFQVVALDAVVHPTNIASLRAFERVGFVPIGVRGEFTVLRWDKLVANKEVK
ncbi:MAG: spore coat polysaccharide biosynthesis protein SpsF [Actinomycetota bacterium]|jgi:spore coat polysaccharide biosynthesis protein SpsF